MGRREEGEAVGAIPMLLGGWIQCVAGNDYGRGV